MLGDVTLNLDSDDLILLGVGALVFVVWIVRRVLKRGSAADANFWGRSTAGAILVLGLVVVVVPGVSHVNLEDDPAAQPVGTTTVTKTDVEGKVSTEVTQGPVSQSLLERGLAQGGLLFLRLGVVVLAAFLAGAFVQRFVLAEFAVEVGGLKLPALAREAATSLDALKLAIEQQNEKLRALSAASQDGLRSLTYETASTLDSVRTSVADERERLQQLREGTLAALHEVATELEKLDHRLTAGNL